MPDVALLLDLAELATQLLQSLSLAPSTTARRRQRRALLHDGVGGTWFWNRYPGARCDVESLDYSYSFDEELQQDWDWSERYATQPEILRYINHVTDRFDLRRDIQLSTRVSEARFDETSNRWKVRSEGGQTFDARYLVMATGCLSIPQKPNFRGLDSFKGRWYHSADSPLAIGRPCRA